MARGARREYSQVDYWDRLVQSDPAGALHFIDEQLTGTGLDSDATSLALGAMSRCQFELGRLDASQATARRALAGVARSERDEVRWAVAMTAAVILAEAGHIDEALDALDALGEESDGVHLGRVRLQMAYVLHHAGRLNEAMLALDMCDQLLGRDAEPRDRMRLHQHRGLVLLQQGRLAEADAELSTAESLAGQQGMTAAQAQSVANRGVLAGRARRLSDSLRCFDRAAHLFTEAGDPGRTVAGMEIDRAEVMMHSGLVLDAVEAAHKAVELVGPTGNRMLLGDALLLVARAELTAGMLRDAVRSADVAAAVLDASGRREMVAHARSVAAHAELRRARTSSDAARCLDATRALVGELRADGWHQQADELVLARVRVGSRFGSDDRIGSDLDYLRLGAFTDQRDLALAGWYAEAICRRNDDRPGEALDACRVGLDHLDEIVAEAPTLEQRSATMRLGNDLSQLTIELAVRLGDADTVLAAAEGTRARALHDELADQHRHRPLTDQGADQLRRELAVRLGDRVLVEWVVAGGEVWAVVFDAAGSRLVLVGDANEISKARDRVLVWLDLAASEPDESSVRALRAAALLDEMLVGPLGMPLDCGVVHVPVGLLHGIPWAGLPSFAGRPMTLVPNAQVWLEADRRSTGAVRSVGFVSGPDVGNDTVEQAAVERWHPGAAVAAGAGATAPTVRSMFAGHDLVHVAAHGRFRSDRPLLSTLRLFDGASTLYDTVPDRIGARLVVLSSCEGGAQGTADGSEVLGLSSVLLARGAAAVLAPLTVVRELECADFVAEVHAELATGEPFACAVASVRERWLADDDLSRWAVASSFTCFGSGAVTLAVD